MVITLWSHPTPPHLQIGSDETKTTFLVDLVDLFTHYLCPVKLFILQDDKKAVDILEGQFTDLDIIGCGGQGRVYR